jgi:hypothetical protein
MDFLQIADGREEREPQPVSNYQQIPRLETKQTASLRSEYPLVEYLESGQIADWLKERKDQLLVFAREERVGVAISKTVGAAATLAGFIFHATSPLAPIGGLLGAAGYLWAQIRDTQHTHTFSPIPFLRGNLMDTVGSFGHSEARKELISNWDEFEQLKGYLPPTEQHEYTMLRQHFITVTDIIKRIEPYKRFHAYRLLLDFYIESKGYFPEPNDLDAHMMNVEVDTRVDYEIVAAIQERQSQSQLVSSHNNPKFMTTRRAEYAPSLSPSLASSLPVLDNTTATSTMNTQTRNSSDIPSQLEEIKKLALHERVMALIKLLDDGGFDIGKCIRKQVTVIAGAQRGGKGTLMGILSILSAALKPGLKIHYFTAGDDIYPFQCDKLVCAANFPNAQEPDAKVASALIDYLKEMEGVGVGEWSDRILVIDEAVALGEYTPDDKSTWMAKFLLSRAAKKGARIFIVLHGYNLTSWLGSGKTGGMSQTFKEAVSFIGCKSTSVKISPLETIDVATGEYFLADPEAFAVPLPDGEIGTLPDWLKTETNPLTGQPDPIRTLLKYFPEFKTQPQTILPSPENLTAIPPVNQVSSDTEAVRETVLQDVVIKDAAITVIQNPQVDSGTDELEEIVNSRENDFMFIMAMSEIASAHITENKWGDFNTEGLRRINKFRGADAAGRHLNRNEGRAVAKVLSTQNKLQIISEDNYRAQA